MNEGYKILQALGFLLAGTTAAHPAITVNNNTAVDGPSTYTLNSQVTNDEPGAILNEGTLNIYQELAQDLLALPGNASYNNEVTTLMADWDFNIDPTGEVFTGWSATINPDGSVSINNNDFDWDIWSDNSSRDMQAYSVVIPKSQLEYDGVAGYDPNTDASIVLSDTTIPDAFAGSEGGAGGVYWSAAGTYYEIAIPAPGTYALSISKEGSSLVLDFNGTLQKSTNLHTWTTLDPQPASPHPITLEPNQKVFYRLEDGQHGP
jgi:hypothetical protein